MSGLVILVVAGLFAGGVFRHQSSNPLLGSVQSSLGKYVTPVGDTRDSASVYRWAEAACKDAPLDVLAMAYHVKVSRAEIRRAVARSFPHSTKSAALRGCERGLRSNPS